MRTFDKSLEYGHGGELEVMGILIANGAKVICTADYKTAENKAPQIHGYSGYLSPPDLDCFNNGKRYWVEVKRYGTSAWNRSMKCNVHGIERRLYDTYMEVQQITGAPVYLAIWEETITSEDCKTRTETDVILWAKLDALETFPCMCEGCRRGIGCFIDWKYGLHNGVYFRRRDFDIKPELQRRARSA